MHVPLTLSLNKRHLFFSQLVRFVGGLRCAGNDAMLYIGERPWLLFHGHAQTIGALSSANGGRQQRQQNARYDSQYEAYWRLEIARLGRYELG